MTGSSFVSNLGELYVKFDKNGKEKFRVFCGQPGTGQVKWNVDTSQRAIDAKNYIGAVCDADGSIYIGSKNVGPTVTGP